MKISLQKEINGLKKLPTLRLKKELRQYELLLKFNTELFWFCFTLQWRGHRYFHKYKDEQLESLKTLLDYLCIIPLLFFKFSIITWTLALLYHYFFAWKKANPIIEGKHQLETEREEVSLIIEEIQLAP